MKCLVLAGGQGDRLWPLSRKNYPKQFIKNDGGLSLFQATITRNIPFCDEFVVVTNAIYEAIVLGQLQQFQGLKYQLYLEETGLGTAGAIALATSIFEENEDVLIVPSDTIMGQEGYSDAIFDAKQIASLGKIALLGVTPSSASTTFGYIQFNGNDVRRYIEKPSFELADKLFWNADILWNSGIVLTNVKTLSEQMQKCCPSVLSSVSELVTKAKITSEQGKLLDDKQILKQSFEHSVLEKSESLGVVRIHCDWNQLDDLNGYEAMYGSDNDDDNVLLYQSKNTSVLNNTEGQMVVTNGLKDIMVVNTPDVVYITEKSKADHIKEIVENYSNKKPEYFTESPLVFRPWGSRELIQQSEGYRVRRLSIYPGMKLSRHKHENRNENYVVVSGELTIELENEIVTVNPRECYNILPQISHRLRNNSDDIVIVIEVDTGAVIDEIDMISTDAANEKPVIIPALYQMHPAYKDYLWGGTALVDKYKKDSTLDVTAESWELSAHPDGPSDIVGGPMQGMTFDKFIKTYGDKVCGWKSRTFDRFPVLIKFIDARNALSVQIHPDDDYAFVNENEFGKNEMWYVMDCEPGSYLYCGLSKECSKEEIRERIENTTLTEVLNKIEVKKGDVIFVPAGTIHAIGAGILICEIQQNSNCTYRMYDYGRRDKNGNLRELHIDKALDVVNVEPYFPDTSGFGDDVVYDRSTQRVLSRCKYFQVTDYKIPEHEVIQVDESSFKSIVVLDGECTIRVNNEECKAKAGDSFFVAAGRRRVHVEGNCEIVVTNI